jgi:predicted nucleic acid-binding protein
LAPPPLPPALVLDTNVVLAWWVFDDPATAAVAQAVDDGRVRWHATPPMLAELDRVLARPLPPRWEPMRQRALTLNRCHWLAAVPAPPATRHGLDCADRDDQMFVDLALHLRALWLLTRDRALLALAPKAAGRGLAILPPERWPG